MLALTYQMPFLEILFLDCRKLRKISTLQPPKETQLFSSFDFHPFCNKFSTAIRIFVGIPFICTYFDTEDALRPTSRATAAYVPNFR